MEEVLLGLVVFLLFVGVIATLIFIAAVSSVRGDLRAIRHQAKHNSEQLELARRAFWAMQQRLHALEQWLGTHRDAIEGLKADAPEPTLSSEAAERKEQDAPAEEEPAAEAGVEAALVRDGSAEDASAGEEAAEAPAEPRDGVEGEPSPAAEVDEPPLDGQARPGRERERRALETLRDASVGAGPASAPQTDGHSAAPQAPPAAAAGAAAAPTTAAGAGPTPAAPPAAQPIEWEQWVGVRGAAVLGAAILVLAGGYLFKYSIDHGLLSPALRVVLGTLAGLACVVAGETWLRRRHELLANSLIGAGIAILYVSFWAAAARYQLINTAVASGLMIVVTVACCVLSDRRRSRAVALFGLVGGFATPILVHTGHDRPVALFTYLLLLDGALLLLAHRRRWPLLAVLSLVATSAYQVFWIFGRMDPERLLLGLGITVVFAVLFAVTPIARPAAGQSEPATAEQLSLHYARRTARIAAIGLPFLFALYFGLRSELTPRLYPVGILLVLLVVGASFLARREAMHWLGVSATGAAAGVLASWLLTHEVSGWLGWEVMGLAVVLAALLHGMVEWERWRRPAAPAAAERGADQGSDAPDPSTSVWLVSSLLLSLLAVTSADEISPWPWLIGWVVLAALAMRHGSWPERGPLQVVVPGLVGMALVALVVPHIGRETYPAPEVMVALVTLIAVAHQVGTMALARGRARTLATHGSALLAVLLLLLVPSATEVRVELYVGCTLALELLVAFAAARTAAAAWLLPAMVLTALVQCGRMWLLPSASPYELGALLAGHGLSVLLVASWPFALGQRARESRWSYRTAALAGPIFFPTSLALHEELWGDGFIAATPLVLAAISLGAAFAARGRGPQDPEVRRSALAWLAGACLGFVAVAIPLQLRNEWVTIGWSLLGLALLGLWRRLDHAGLKYVALVLFGVVMVRLIGNPYVFDYHPRSSLRILNWLSYTYVVPAACMLGGFLLLRTHEALRRRSWESFLEERPLGAQALAAAAVVVLFVWINLTIFDWFSVERYLTLSFHRLPARDLSLSIAWAVYGLVLLGIGVWRQSKGLRALSLTLVLLTCGKVFLYDLSHLRDLYRVMSLVGLALSLIAISLAYKRFVFRGESSGPPPAGGAT